MSDSPSPSPRRLVSIDAYRGLVMFLMLAEVLHLSRLARAFPDCWLCQLLAFHQSHVEWAGCSLHDLIQPSFSFLVGVALPFSLVSRAFLGQPRWLIILHAAWRALLLVLLGIFLRSVGKPQTNFTFEDTLTQIGLGYFPLFLLGLTRPRWHWAAFWALIIGYWVAFVLYPLPPSDFNYPAVGVPPDWPHLYTGFEAHWNKNSNLAWAFDTWFLNLFPRERPFEFNRGGYATLSFIPTLGTMILGLIAGTWLKKSESDWRKVKWLALTGVLFLAAGWGCAALGICPSVKRIWTPSWTLYSGGWCFLLLAGFHALTEVLGWQAWSFPLRVIGMNSIAAYCMAHLIDGFIISSFRTHLGPEVFRTLGRPCEPLLQGVAILLVYWLILFWMYRRKIFLKI